MNQVEDESRLCQTTSIDEAWQDSGLLKMLGKEVLRILIICYSTAMQFSILLPKKNTQYRDTLSTESACGHKGDYGCKGNVSTSFIWYAFGDGLLRKAKFASSEAEQSSQSIYLKILSIYLTIMTNCINFALLDESPATPLPRTSRESWDPELNLFSLFCGSSCHPSTNAAHIAHWEEPPLSRGDEWCKMASQLS